MYYYQDEYDYVFEDFAEHSGFLTNFDEQRLQQYQKAIEQYKLVDPYCELIISTGYNYPHALYCSSGRKDLSVFWRVFENCK